MNSINKQSYININKDLKFMNFSFVLILFIDNNKYSHSKLEYVEIIMLILIHFLVKSYHYEYFQLYHSYLSYLFINNLVRY